MIEYMYVALMTIAFLVLVLRPIISILLTIRLFNRSTGEEPPHDR